MQFKAIISYALGKFKKAYNITDGGIVPQIGGAMLPQFTGIPGRFIRGFRV
jgi:hypothetical protein